MITQIAVANPPALNGDMVMNREASHPSVLCLRRSAGKRSVEETRSGDDGLYVACNYSPARALHLGGCDRFQQWQRSHFACAKRYSKIGKYEALGRLCSLLSGR